MNRKLFWTDLAWADYLAWMELGTPSLKRLNHLIEASIDTPFAGPGKPEALQHTLAGLWSRRIDESSRLVYVADDEKVTILACQYYF